MVSIDYLRYMHDIDTLVEITDNVDTLSKLYLCYID